MVELENFAIIVAGGKGARMGGETKKQYRCLDKIPVLARTLKTFEKCRHINEIVLVVPNEDKAYCEKYIVAPFGFSKKIHLVGGGSKRQDSVFNGLKSVLALRNPEKETIVLIHDGVRPFVDQGMIENCIDTAVEHGACIPAVQIVDTVKQVSSDNHIQKTLDRQFLYAAQTPQTFKLDVILQAFDHAGKTHFSGTDDASFVEHLGHKVVIVKGSKMNIKLTTPDDLVLGQFLLTRQ